MALAIDTGNVVSDHASFTGTASSTSVTVGASDNLLVVLVGLRYNSGNNPPDGFTFNGVSMAPYLSNIQVPGSQSDVSAWILSSPAVGTHTLAGTWTTNTSGGVFCLTAVPMSGAATSSIFGTVATATSTVNNNPAVSATGGSTGTLYLAAAWNDTGTTTSTGAGQTDVANNGSLGSSNNSFVVSTIAGSGTGAFTWTGGGSVEDTQWAALGFNVNPPPAGAAAIAWIT